jgi:hypothetical protein
MNWVLEKKSFRGFAADLAARHGSSGAEEAGTEVGCSGGAEGGLAGRRLSGGGGNRPTHGGAATRTPGGGAGAGTRGGGHRRAERANEPGGRPRVAGRIPRYPQAVAAW